MLFSFRNFLLIAKKSLSFEDEITVEVMGEQYVRTIKISQDHPQTDTRVLKLRIWLLLQSKRLKIPILLIRAKNSL